MHTYLFLIGLAAAISLSPSQGKEEAVKKVAISFHEWLLTEARDIYSKTAVEVKIVEGENGKCKIDYLPYFENLRSVGTISEEFINSERLRVKECADYISTVDWVEYKQANAYDYDNDCPFIYYYYWLGAMEAYSGVESLSVVKNTDNWDVEIRIYTMSENLGKTSYPHHHLIVTVKEIEGDLKIAKINWKNKK